MLRRLTLLLVLLYLASTTFARETKTIRACRTDFSPHIDGKLNEPEWKNAEVISDFTQFRPYYGKKPSYPTEVRIIYDNYALYIGAIMYDPHPDSILRQLGNRDDEDLNADWFGVQFDTYNNQLDAYTFFVLASGVQQDSRVVDATFNAVWQSAVSVTAEGWIAEMKIPYNAIRFPALDIQKWGIQINRGVRRYREKCQLSLDENGASNNLVNWYKLEGIQDIKPPLRLSLTPYLSASMERYPYNIPDKKNVSHSISGGMDLKYGFNESFTLDVTLLPDFSQVQSDNLIKNLTAFETTYNEQRQFFQEAVDLFQKGSLFYSRRIGRIPLNYYTVEDDLKAGERITKNPFQAKLLNATKFSGRNSKGTAIGIFNAITDNTFATIEDSLGNSRKFLTDPRTNYNIIVLDQALKNNSSVYLINTNVTRDKGYNNANVTGSGLTLNNKSNKYRLTLTGALSQIFTQKENQSGNKEKNLESLGYNYEISGGKLKGKFQFWLARYEKDNEFSANDMGITQYNNETEHYANASYNIFEPKGQLRELSSTIEFDYKQNYQSRKLTNCNIYWNTWGTLLNYLSIWLTVSTDPARSYDYYEPRTTGRYFYKPAYHTFEVGISSDYRKPFALDMSQTYIFSDYENFGMYKTVIRPIFRINDHLGFDYRLEFQKMVRDVGYAGKVIGTETNPVYFGRRDVDEMENTLTVKYLFKNNLSLNFRARHYLSMGTYDKFYLLQQDGTLSGYTTYNGNPDFTFTAFNIDMVGSWEFAPGSRLELVWKNSILDEGDVVIRHYWENIRSTWDTPQLNTFTVKFLYYIDYQSISSKKHK